MNPLTRTATGAVGATTAAYAIRGFAFSSDDAGEAVITDTVGQELGRLKTTATNLVDGLNFTGVLHAIGMNVTILTGTDARLTIYVE